MKKTLSLLLVACMIFSTLGAGIFPVEAASTSATKPMTNRPIPDQLMEQKNSDTSSPTLINDAAMPSKIQTGIESEANQYIPASNESIVASDTDNIPESPILYESEQLIEEDKIANPGGDMRAEAATGQISFSLDKRVIKVGEPTEVTITVLLDGIPAPDLPIIVAGTNYGVTGADGKLTFTITYGSRSYLQLQIGSIFSSPNELFAVNSDEGVVEISGLDRSGNPIQNFRALARSQNSTFSRTMSGKVIRTIAKQGLNTVMLMTRNIGNVTGYFMSQELTVVSGIVNPCTFDASQNTLEIDFTHTIDGAAAANSEIHISKMDTPFNNYYEYTGTLDFSGLRRMYITPGIYSFASRNINSQNEVVYLRDLNRTLSAEGPCTIAFSTANTGKISFDFGSNIPSTGAEVNLAFNGFSVDMDDKKTLVIDANTYTLSTINLFAFFNTKTYVYDYGRYYSNVGVIPVTANATTNFNADLGIKETRLSFSKSSILLGSSIGIYMYPITNSSYYLYGITDYNNMDLAIEKPNKEIVTSRQSFYSGSFYVKSSDPTGTYKVTATMNLGPLYNNSGITLQGSFSAYVKRELSVDKQIVKIGEDTPVTFTVTSNGVPVANEDIYVAGSYYGKTDSAGKLTATINTQQWGNLTIQIGSGNTFNYMLFGMYSDEGLVEITAKDISGAPIQNFYTHVMSQKTSWGGGASNGIYRAIARQGQNQLMLITNNNNSVNGYYFMKNISVAPGVVNPIVLDAAQETIAARISAMLDGAAYSNAELSIGKQDCTYPFLEDYIGNLSASGEKVIYVSPGVYSVSVKSYNSNNEVLNFNRKPVSLTAGANHQFSFSTAQTGKIIFNYSDIDVSTANKKIIMNDTYVFMGNRNILITEQNNYRISFMSIDNTYNNRWYNYEFRKDWDYQDTIPVTAGTDYYYEANLGLNRLELVINSNKVNPGSKASFRLYPVTNRGYYINYITDYYNMDVTIEKPDGQIDTFRQSFRNGSYYVQNTDPEGTYKVTASFNLGPLYNNMVQSAANTFNVIGKRELSVDKPVITYGEQNTVKFTVTSNGTPVANESIFVEGTNYGNTNANGTLTAAINPYDYGNLQIKLGNGTSFGNKLFNIEANEGVVAVSLTDVSGNPLKYFYANIWQNNMGWSGDTGKGTVWLIGQKGQNILRLTTNTNEYADGYYIVKNIDVSPGVISPVLIDGAQDTVEADLSFIVDGVSITNANVNLLNTDLPYNYYGDYVGEMQSNGIKKLYVTPGTYKISMRNTSSNNEILFMSTTKALDSNGQYPINWSLADTGRVNLDFGSGMPANTTRWLNLNDMNVYLHDSTTLILQQDSYRVNSIGARVEINGEETDYNYYKDWDYQDVIDVTAGTNINFAADMGIQDVKLYIENPIVYTNNHVNYWLHPITNSGYRIDYIRGYNSMDVTIEKPNLDTVNLVQDFKFASYYVSDNEPEGIYKINATKDLGPLYGNQTYTVQNSFKVLGRRELAIDKPIIKVGEPTQVVFTVTTGGKPVLNEFIKIGSYTYGVTDSNGKFTATIKPYTNGNIDIWVGQQRFSYALFGVFDDEGVVEVTAMDILGDKLEFFEASAKSEYMNWGRGSENGIVKLIAKQGQNTLTLSCGSDNNNNAYYIVKDINVAPGVFNPVAIDPRQGTAKADFIFNINKQLVDNADIFIEKTDGAYALGNMHMGRTDFNGFRRIYVSPGTYKLGLRKVNSQQEVLYLNKENLSIIANGTFELDWDTSNTGKVNINLGDKVPVGAERWIHLNGSYIGLGQSNTLILSAGDYRVNYIGIGYNENNYWVQYEYLKPWDQQDIITVNPAATFDYNADLTMKEVALQLYGDNLRAGDNLYFETMAATNSGYILNWFSTNNTMDITITKPNGQKESSQQFFRNAWYQVKQEDPEGQYTINAALDLGPVYPAYSLTGSFNVIADQSIRIIAADPKPEAINVPVEQSITLTFDKSIKQGSRYNEILLKTSGGVIVPTTIAISGSKLSILPKAKLSYNTSYTIVVPINAVTDYQGKTLEFDYIASFKTAIDKTAPVVMGTTPLNNAVNVPINTQIAVTYDENIALLQTATKGTVPKVTLKSADGALVPITYSTSGKLLTIKPTTGLKPGVQYTVTIPAGLVADTSRNLVGNSFSFTFKTQAATMNKATNKR